METNKHFILTDEFITIERGIKLYRILCTKKIPGVYVGEQGGFVESYENLSDNAWVFDNAKVYGNARLMGTAWVFGDAEVYGDAKISGNATVTGAAKVSGNAWVYGYAEVYGDATVTGDAIVTGDADITSNSDYSCFQSFGSEGRTTTAFREKGNKIKIRCGCFSGSVEEFEKRVEKTHGDSKFGREYKAVINVINSTN